MVDIPSVIAKFSSWTTFLVTFTAYLILSPLLNWHASQFLNGQPILTRTYLSLKPEETLSYNLPTPALVRQYLLTVVVSTPLLAILASTSLAALLRVPNPLKASSSATSFTNKYIHHVCIVPILAAIADWIQHLLVVAKHSSFQILVIMNAVTWILFYGTGALLILAFTAFTFSIGRDKRQIPPSSSLAAKHYHTLRSTVMTASN